MFSFGNPQQPQQQQQQQPAASNLFSSPGPLSVRDLGSQQQQQQPQPGSLFGQAPQQSLTSTAPNNANNLNPNATAGSGLFSSQPSFGQQSQPQQQQPQQQPQQQTLFSGFTASQPQNAGFLQSQLASSSLSGPQNGSGSTFGNSQLGQSQFGGGSQQPFNTFQPQQGANPGPIQSQQQGSSVSAPQQNQPQQPMSYVPGYLSKIRGGDRHDPPSVFFYNFFL
ncbi:hypothetical protein IE53DRAFT_74632 [Violaceomyces palustris]|uniref:Uncharacterized protein n=1 Tax=Violaceomyces palustris TaxID=1673888 RepID=A0ACD0NYL6_9BASI|nr:hypothetical protein IE53DRAFT_74632 [Violaceomyces palustris]